MNYLKKRAASEVPKHCRYVHMLCDRHVISKGVTAPSEIQVYRKMW